MLASLSHFRPASCNGFVVLDGVNGAGKSTLLKLISEYLTKAQRRVVATREPGATELGKLLRQVLLEHKPVRPAANTEIFLFAADRAEHIERVIAPALQRGDWVISDRYYYSTVAFQGYGRQLGKELTLQVNRLAVGPVVPDLVIIPDISAEEGLKRAKRRDLGGNDKDAFEAETLEFHERLRCGFLDLAKELAEPFLVLDARRTPDELLSDCIPYLDKLIACGRATACQN